MASEFDIFPVSWLNEREYCEYLLYLKYVRKLKAPPTPKMVIGKADHSRLYQEFRKESVSSTLEKVVKETKVVDKKVPFKPALSEPVKEAKVADKKEPTKKTLEPKEKLGVREKEQISILSLLEVTDSELSDKVINSREVSLKSEKYGVSGRVDEVFFGPNSILVVEDKSKNVVYNGDKQQVRAYSLILSETIKEVERPIIGVLRQIRSQKVYWNEPFNRVAENNVVRTISRVHALLDKQDPQNFLTFDNPNKCLSCSFREVCDRKV